jgi:hypothetical protein
MEKTCFVIQPFDNDIYDKLFDDIFSPAITGAGLNPYRVDKDPSTTVPIDAIEKGIKSATICFAEITTDNPNVWFELGYAISQGKPICMVSQKRKKYPFDVQHRRIITYEKQPAPSDFQHLKEKITAALKARLLDQDAFESNREAISSLSSLPETQGLKSHELLALTVVMQNHFTGGIVPSALLAKIERVFAAPAGSLSIIGLKRKGLIQFSVEHDSYHHDSYEVINVSQKGEDWLMENQEKLKLTLPNEREDNDTNTDDIIEITDADIPF